MILFIKNAKTGKRENTKPGTANIRVGTIYGLGGEASD